MSASVNWLFRAKQTTIKVIVATPPRTTPQDRNHWDKHNNRSRRIERCAEKQIPIMMNPEMDLDQPSMSRMVEFPRLSLTLQPAVDTQCSSLLTSPAEEINYASSGEDMMKTPSPSPINVSPGTSPVACTSPPPEAIAEADPDCYLSAVALKFRYERLWIIWQETNKQWVDIYKTSFPYLDDLRFRVKVQLAAGIADDNPTQSLWRKMWDSKRAYWSLSKVIARLQEESTRKRIHLWTEAGQYHSQDMELWETVLNDDAIRREVELDVSRENHRVILQFPAYFSLGDLRLDSRNQFAFTKRPRVGHALDSPPDRVPQSAGTNCGSASGGSAASHVSNVASIKDALCWSPPPSFVTGSVRKRGSSSSSAEYDRSVKRVRKQNRLSNRTREQRDRSAGAPGSTGDTRDQGAEAPTEYGWSPHSTRGKLTGQQQSDVLTLSLPATPSPNLVCDDYLGFGGLQPSSYMGPWGLGNLWAATQDEPLVTSSEQPRNELALPPSHKIEGQNVRTDNNLPNQDSSPNNSEQLALHDTPISRKMTTPEVVSHLVAHGCRNLTDALNHVTFSQHPVSHGGFSDVYRGHLLDTTQVAVKALRISISSMAENPKHLKHAARELHTWSKCSHPNVLQLLGFAVFRDRIAMVSPWMGQGNLNCYIERTPDVSRRELCTQICEGLSYLHQVGIIHGDLKGANVLISNDGAPVLADFGNSTHANQSMKFTQTTSEKSWTMRWSAPELIMGSGLQSKAADVYALGMTIYEIMTGTLPYNGKLEHTIIYLVVTKKEPPERPHTIPIGHEDGNKLWELLVRCWSFEPESRPSANETSNILKTITLDGLGHIAAPTTGFDLN